MRPAAALTLLLLVGACKSPFARYCESSADCTDPAYPVCDLTGESAASGGHGKICVPGTADAGTTTDAVSYDADESVPPETPSLLAPANGAFTGSHLIAASRRPVFRWLAAVRAVRYEIQIEDSCAVPDFQGCAFASPELTDDALIALQFRPSTPLAASNLHPVGRRYFWRVRACNAAGCSSWSAIRYLNVGRQVNDFGGDGFADRLTGRVPDSAASQLVGAGYVHLGRASLSGTADSPDVELSDPTALDGGGFAGAVAAVGDVNGDGYSDYVVGAESHASCDGAFGAAYLYLGGPSMTGVPTTTLRHPQALENGGTECTPRFGRTVAGGGDLNGDGFADFVVAAPDQASSGTRPGRVFVYLGRPTWPSSVELSDIVLTDPNGALNGLFGAAVSLSGDLDGDGLADIAVGAGAAARPEAQEGNVFIYRGRQSWGAAPAVVGTPDVIIDNPEDSTMAFFGVALSSEGDLDGDGYADLVAGAPLRSGTQSLGGVAFLFRGRPGWPALVEAADATIESPAALDFANFGYSVSSGGDVNGDGLADLCVGAPTKDSAGQAFVFFGRASWPAALAAADVALANGAGQTVGQLGIAVSVRGDMDGDGLADVAIGTPGAANPEAGEGNVLVWLGRTAWPATPSAGFTIDAPGDLTDGRFGAAMQ